MGEELKMTAMKAAVRCGSMCVEIHTNTASGDRMFAFSVKENIPSHA